MLLVAGSDAQLSTASKAPIEQRTKVLNTRGLKAPDCGSGVFSHDDPVLLVESAETKLYSEQPRPQRMQISSEISRH